MVAVKSIPFFSGGKAKFQQVALEMAMKQMMKQAKKGAVLDRDVSLDC